MRRDVYIENDSGGFSVIAAEAADAIIEDAREDDGRFVDAQQAVLQLLYGDDSMVVRVVVDEPLRPEEEGQWLARSTSRLRTDDGRVLVMGGFDPDVLSWWREGSGGRGDGRGVACIEVPPGEWQVDLYAHVGSMNGRAILSEAGDTPPGAAFRRDHPGRPFPLWLAQMLDYSGEEDPGHEALWKDVRASVAEGRLAVDVDGADVVGMLVHLTRATGDSPRVPDDLLWFDHDHGQRIPSLFPLGLPAEVADPGVADYRDRVAGRTRPTPPEPVATAFVPVLAAWTGPEPAPLEAEPVMLAPAELYLLHWMAAMSTDASTRFELRIDAAGWTPPAATPDFAVLGGDAGPVAIGPVTHTGGWHTWWASRSVAQALGVPPEGTRFDLGVVPQSEGGDPDPHAPGTMRHGGRLAAGRWLIEATAPAVPAPELGAALDFLREMLDGRLHLRSPAERSAFDRQARMFAREPGALAWDGDKVRIVEDEVRIRILLAQSVFRLRFGGAWPMAQEEEDDDE